MRIEEVIGERIREVRDLQELTQEQFGQRLGQLLGRAWSRQAVSAAEAGGRQFTAAELVAIAHVLGTTVPRLLTPPVAVREVELPSGVKLDRLPLTERVFPRGGALKVFDEMREQLRTLAQASAAQRQYQSTIVDAIDLLYQSLTTAIEATAFFEGAGAFEGDDDGQH